MLPVSSISVAANRLRALLADQIDDVDEAHIKISHPKDMSADAGVQGLNLFFYRVEFGGFPADAAPDSPFFVRLNCLITALGSDESVSGGGGQGNMITAGENDLRLIGEVMRVLHQHPAIPLNDDQLPLLLEAVYQPLSLDDLNHVWSTQGDTAYRLSVAYEFCLVPIPLAAPMETRPRVGGIGLGVRAQMEGPPLPSHGFAIAARAPQVPRTVIDTSRLDWSPHICFVENDQALLYVKTIPDTYDSDVLEVLVAGAGGAQVAVTWQPWEWDYQDNTGGWRQDTPDTETPLALIPSDDDPTQPLAPNVIDPDAIETRLKHTVRLPYDTAPDEEVRRQCLLYAVREWDRSRLQAAPERLLLRSNPLLVTIYHEESAP